MDILKNIDGKATQKAIEKVLRQYRTYQLTTPEDMLPTITANYTLNMPSYSGGFHSKVENAAIRNVEHYKQAKAFFERFNRGFYKLSQKERQIIVMACLEETPLFNYQISKKLNISERTFYRIKAQALYKLALRVEVYEGESQ
ncbi:ArpU family transcriptional regulator [Lysinibacillus sp. CD3-6]|uniref:ArpU family phage packaging/lysis transcriptional regulator n=1 Tax=Lysinibacillus sp. CD3-6 TaxID=2892541 RepID=UPI00155F5138|nr:ArpU family phage packaging/lysis transcriptional regulator [Lysinibacillus sp. CD3-6]UED78423.1 ArpU family transcriptional regulator [Lysinibacillus sp. CD3-6]